MGKIIFEMARAAQFFLLCTGLMFECIQAATRPNHFKKVFGADQKAEVMELASLSNVTRRQCAGDCMNDTCLGFNYMQETPGASGVGACQLLTKEAGISNMVPQTGMDYFEKLDDRKYCVVIFYVSGVACIYKHVYINNELPRSICKILCQDSSHG
jgi:hypothetical protein